MATILSITQRPRDPSWPMIRAANAACDLARVLHQIDLLDRQQPYQPWDQLSTKEQVRYVTLGEYLIKLLPPLLQRLELTDPALDALTEGEEQP